MAGLTTALMVGSKIAEGIGQRRGAKAVTDEGARLAADVLERGAEDELAYRRDLAQILGAQRATFAAQGVDVGFGTAKMIADETRQFGEEDAMMIRENAIREAWGIRQSAAGQARAMRWGAAASFVGAAGAALSGPLDSEGSTLLTKSVDAWQSYRNRSRGVRLRAPAALPRRSSMVPATPSFGNVGAP
jgi:hypothetical protein